MGDGWLSDPENVWTLRFHRDQKSWIRDPKVFVDLGRAMPDGSPALLKSRQHLRRGDAQKMWRELLQKGWKPRNAVWGPDADP